MPPPNTILAGVRKEVQKGQLKTAAAKFAKASKEQAQTLRELEALPRPSADEAPRCPHPILSRKTGEDFC